MAVQFIGTTSGSALNGGSPAITYPGPFKSSDVAIVTVCIGSSLASTITLSVASSSGATTLYTQIVTTVRTSLVAFGVFRRVIASTAEQAISITGNAANLTAVTGVVHIFRGVDTTTPEDTTATSTTGASSTPDSPSITPVSFGAGIITSVGMGTATSALLAAPTGYLNAQSTISADTDPASVGQAWIGNGSTSAASPPAWSSSSVKTWASATVALRPAAITWSQAGIDSAEGLMKEARRVVINSY